MRTIILGSTILIAACATVDYEQRVTLGDDAVGVVPVSWQTAQAELGEVEVGWIASFNDPLLSALVEESLAQNRNLQASAANVDRAWALARQAGAATTPSLGFTTGTQNSGLVQGSSGSASVNAGLQASWEIDLWGRISSGQGAAVASAQAAEADYLFAQYSLAAGVARAYFIAVEAAQQEVTARNIVEALEKTLHIIDVRLREGMATAQDLALMRGDLASARESLAAVEGGRRDALRALELLLGRYPGAEVEVRNQLPMPPEQPAAGLPASLLERRPDLIAAERRIAASIAGVDQAKAARLPQLSLTANVGGSSTGLTDLLNPANLAWQGASNLLVPVFDGGARKEAVEIAGAEEEAAVASYAQAALSAFGEVEQALDQGNVLSQRLTDLQEARDEAKEALRLTQLQFDEGETDLLDVLTIQQRFYGREGNLFSLHRALLVQHLDLNLALCGHW